MTVISEDDIVKSLIINCLSAWVTAIKRSHVVTHRNSLISSDNGFVKHFLAFSFSLVLKIPT